jgi:hypothetical protein
VLHYWILYHIQDFDQDAELVNALMEVINRDKMNGGCDGLYIEQIFKKAMQDRIRNMVTSAVEESLMQVCLEL